MAELDKDRQIQLFIHEALEMLEVAEATLSQAYYSTAINRAYYAVFYAANAALTAVGIARKKHTAVLSEFRKQFIKTGIFDDALSDFYGQLMDDRHAVDYDLTHDMSREEVAQNVNQAREFVEKVRSWLKQ